MIPAYNVAATIGDLVAVIRRQGLDPIVVNDGSVDATAAKASAAGAFVISHVKDRGKGLALRAGFRQALRAGYGLIVTIDGDGQHDPAEIPTLLHAAGPRQLAIGHRTIDQHRMPPVRRATNRLVSMIVSRMTGQTVPDAACGFRGLPSDLLRGLTLRGRRYDLEIELLLHAAALGWTIASVPIRTIYQQQRSAIRPVRDGLRFVRLIARHAVLPPARSRTPKGQVPHVL